jgi:septal ring factor EnvC (AmiA/AmiB activator)
MKRTILTAALCLAAAVPGFSQDPNAAEAAQKMDLVRLLSERGQVEQELKTATEKIYAQDAEIKALADSLSQQAAKLKALVEAKLKADPKTAALLTKREQITKAMKDMRAASVGAGEANPTPKPRRAADAPVK